MRNLLRTLRQSSGKLIMRMYKEYLRQAGVKIGSGGMISLFAHVDVTRGTVIIKDNVTITAGCYILSHSSIERDMYPNREPRTKTVIEDNVFIGVNTVILPGVTLGENSIVGAGSVVTSDVDANSVYAGNPAKKISSTSGR